MRIKFYLITALSFLLIAGNLTAQKEDSVKVYWLNQIEVTSKKENVGDASFPIEKDNLSNVLGKNGFSLIRKGVFFAQDIYADGMKKGDINVVVDGERYHSACPNRMDSPLTRINPDDLESINLNKSSGNLQSGLGGVVQFNRKDLQDPLQVRAGISGVSGAMNGMDGTASVEYLQNKINVRYAAGKPYEDGDGKSFKDLYGYESNFTYKLAEASYRGNVKDWKYGASFSYTEDVSFPYLMMDERANRVASAFASFKENKLYFNYTSHVMDNDLRNSKMLMVTGAQNLTIGMVGEFYEVVYRNWDADNRFTMPNGQIDNQLIPNVSSYHASLHKLFTFTQFELSAKGGVTYLNVGESERKTFYEAIHNDVKDSRIFPTFGLSLSYSEALSSEIGIGFLAEAASEAPETEALFIAVQKPMDKPNWSGNPTLDQPVRSTIRTSFNYSNLRLELFGSRIWNYVDLATASTQMKKYQTYANINALMAGVNFEAAWEYFNVSASYTWAENSSTKSALSEIPPLKITSTINSPELAGVKGFVRHTYNNAQLRIDDNAKETTTGAWNRFDVGLFYQISGVVFALEVENIADLNYAQHLSFLRSPYSTGIKVNEPGRTFRLRLTWSGLFSE
ncbi:MAG: hypothetical protein HND52_07520 [Ignavibacteriae bacterium]|nr:hypothetical protein [Ignavibacteriota bacterium]NOG97794.1 hypothetical protein [Ignavibacteriota bacterium]